MSIRPSLRTSSSESVAPWTATRCHRLLRPLLTHISALRKDKERRDLIKSGQGVATLQQANLTNARPRKSVVLGKRPRGYPESDDDYGSEKKKKKQPLRKYGRRGRPRAASPENLPTTPHREIQRRQQQRQPNRPSQENEVVLPTPFLRRVRNHLPSSPAVPVEGPADEVAEPLHIGSTRCNHSACCKTRCSFDTELRNLRQTMDAERHGLSESVVKAMASLLKATAPSRNRAAAPKSLLAMCLRKVPEYIDWEKNETEDDDDTNNTAPKDCGLSFEIYSELEDLGVAVGWKHLCIVARAHGVKIIQDAAAEGLFEDPITDLLVRLCLEYMPFPEFTDLIETYITRQYPRPRSSREEDDDIFTAPALNPLRILRICDPSGTSLLPRLLSTLLVDELLPSDWILTKGFSTFWPSVINHIAVTKRPCQDTLTFTIETLTLLCNHAAPRKPRGVPQTQIRGKAQNTLVSAIGALGSVVLLSEEGLGDNPSPSNRTSIIKRRVEHVVAATTTNLKCDHNKGRKLGTYLLALCSFLSLSSNSSSTILEQAWNRVTTCKGNPTLMLQYDATTALMSSLAHFCGKGTGLPPNIYLERLCDKLVTLSLPVQALRDIRVDGAFRLAEVTGDLRDLKFAEDLRRECGTPVQLEGEEKKKKAGFGGFRWDEGIGEWVVGTPGSAVPAKRRKAASGTRRSSRGRAAEEVRTEEDEDEEEDDLEVKSVDVTRERRILRGRVVATEESSEEEDEEAEDESMEVYSDAGSRYGSEADASSPNTEASSEEEPMPEPEQSSADEISFEDETMVFQSPPKKPTTKQQQLLAARPKRLSKPITRGGDELAMDAVTTVIAKQEKWLSRKKPFRFATFASAPPKKRVQRMSLMSVSAVDDDSDDELSFI
ncbi:hypothetical protein QBC38DRAFT_484703 [Podospora fimiseda]|uniref:Uncharacterized protein n=1 Tax=Podospora fimiseda TaxID=252190 RepID=A0AAN7GQR2_9PEZI|nr:hypothetical protein QBC38DRAFT_484703 [Podospora fimiseda]